MNMKRKIWRSGNSLVITIPSEIAEKLHLIEKRLVDFDIKNVFEETEKMFDNFFEDERMFLEPMKNTKKELQFRQPLVDLKETEKEFIATLEIPGVDKKDIQLNITDNSIEVKVEKKSEMKIEDENKGYIRSERVYNGFYRSMSLPSRVISQKAKASYKNGILEVIIPKSGKEIIQGNRVEIE